MADEEKPVVVPAEFSALNMRLHNVPGTHDITLHPLYKGKISRWLWRLYTHRFTQAGRWFFWPTLLLTLVGLTSLELQVFVVVPYLLIYWFSALVVSLLLPVRVSLQVRHAERICAGETLPIEITLAQQSRLPAIDLQVLPEKLPLGLGASPATGVSAPILQHGEECRLRLGIYAPRRGVFALKGYRVECDFPFGLFNAYRFFSVSRPLLVYPAFTPLNRLTLPTGNRYHPGGVALRAIHGDSFELLGNREYQAGDNIRHIDWRATARLQTAILREYTQEYFLRVGVVLDTQLVAKEKGALENFENAVSLCAAVSDYMARQDYLVDIFAAGPNLFHLTAGQSLIYLDEILDILACVESTGKEAFETLAPEISQSLGKITLIICVFLDWTPARKSFIDLLSLHGVAVKILLVRDAACTLAPDTSYNITQLTGEDIAAGVEEL